MTYRELVREYLPDADDDECDFILWEKTAFPMCKLDTLKRQIEEYVIGFNKQLEEFLHEPNCCDCEFTYDGGDCDNCTMD